MVGGVAAGWAAERMTMRRVVGTAAAKTDALESVPAAQQLADDVIDRTMATDDGGVVHWIEPASLETAGEPAAPLVLLHGITLEAEAWFNQFDLCDVARVMAIDLRGHGRSVAGTDGATIATNASDLATLLEREDLRNAVLVGHSMGGMVVAHLLATAPADVIDRVRGVVFVGSAVRSPVRRLPGQARLEGIAQRTALAAVLGTVPDSDAGHLAVLATFGRRPSPADVQAVVSSFDRLHPDTFWQSMPSIMDHDVRDLLGLRTDLGELDIAVMVGERDRLTPVRCATELAAVFPQATLEIVPEVGHQLMMEAPETLNARLRSILAGS